MMYVISYESYKHTFLLLQDKSYDVFSLSLFSLFSTNIVCWGEITLNCLFQEFNEKIAQFEFS